MYKHLVVYELETAMNKIEHGVRLLDFVHQVSKSANLTFKVVLKRSHHAHSKTGFSYVLPLILRKLYPNNQEIFSHSYRRKIRIPQEQIFTKINVTSLLVKISSHFLDQFQEYIVGF